MSTSEEKLAARLAFVKERPPRVRFTTGTREAFGEDVGSLDHVEFMMSLMEAHPLIPFESITFGSDVLDFRRGLAYEIVLRQLAHTRSLVENTNGRNRPGLGAALRCMLEMHAFSEYLLGENRIEDRGLLEKLYHGRAFTPGGWYDIEREWESQYAQPLPEHAKELLKGLLNLPRVGAMTSPLHNADKGASYVYSVYSEFIHPAFGRPRAEMESEWGKGASSFGSEQYYTALLNADEPIQLFVRDIAVASFCLELFWPRLLDIDPYFDQKSRAAVIEKLKQQGVAHPPDTPS